MTLAAVVEADHLAQFLDGPVGTVTVGFVDDEHVCDLEDAGFERLNLVARSGWNEDGNRIRSTDDVDLVLARADGFDDDLVFAERVHRFDGVGGRGRESAEGPRALIERTKTSMSPTVEAIRIRSPRTAPPVNGEEGSIATIPTVSPRSR